MNIIQNLERNYKLFIDTKEPFSFFKGLAEYLEYIHSVPKLKKVFNEYIEERNKQYRKIEKLEDKIEQEFNDSRQKIIYIIERKKIDTNKFQRYVTFPSFDTENVFKEFEDFLSGGFISGGFRTDRIQQYLFEFAINLKKMGCEKDIKDFLVSDKEFVFSKTFPERLKAVNLLEKERLFKPWGSFEELYKLRKAYNYALNDTNHWYNLNYGIEKSEFDMHLENRNEVDICNMIEDFKFLINKSPTSLNLNQTNWNKIKKLHIEPFKNAVQITHNNLLQSLWGENSENKKYENLTKITLEKNGLKRVDENGKERFYPIDRTSDRFVVFEASFNGPQRPKNIEIKGKKSVASVKTDINKTAEKLLCLPKKYELIINDGDGYKINDRYEIISLEA
jgi:hypothetical protein